MLYLDPLTAHWPVCLGRSGAMATLEALHRLTFPAMVNILCLDPSTGPCESVGLGRQAIFNGHTDGMNHLGCLSDDGQWIATEDWGGKVIT